MQAYKITERDLIERIVFAKSMEAAVSAWRANRTDKFDIPPDRDPLRIEMIDEVPIVVE